MSKYKVLFVCMGNICRSPTAEGFFRDLVVQKGSESEFLIDSAGTTGYHHGEAPDPRAIAAAIGHHIDLRSLRARQVSADDFHEFDYVLAMDRANLQYLESIQPPNSDAVVELFLNFAMTEIDEVPDPYYGGDEGFEHVISLIQKASEGLFLHIKEKC